MQVSDEEQQLINNSSPRLIDLIIRLLVFILQLESKIHDLENKLNLNSTNSSVPPSKDPFHKRKISNSRKSTDKKPGGQIGHVGTTLTLVETRCHH
jgi:transposase